jgi:hypothetical protein
MSHVDRWISGLLIGLIVLAIVSMGVNIVEITNQRTILANQRIVIDNQAEILKEIAK